jgi:hypothetical protein
MRGNINDTLRFLIAVGVHVLGVLFLARHQIRLSTFRLNQWCLRRKYRIESSTPILRFGAELETRINAVAARAGPDARFATTSGSIAKQKRVLFTGSRLRSSKITFVDMFARCCLWLSLTRTSLYVFSSFEEDESLTSLLLKESKLPNYLHTLQAPHRVQSHPVFKRLVSAYGATAVRLWILTIANPAVLYSTNPSTLAHFLEELETNWEQSSRLIREWTNEPDAIENGLKMIARRLASSGSQSRLQSVANSVVPLSLEACAPAIKMYICWTGGYVEPFLRQISSYLPSPRLMPMYSMSTETIETISHFNKSGIMFLPMASKVLYEFIEEGLVEDPAELLKPSELQPGKRYSMIVSDSYGLSRYQTGDLFYCRQVVNKLPDLAFVGRKDLEYSFTGEKLTAEHVSEAFQTLREEFPAVGTERFLTCLPAPAEKGAHPHYKIVLVEKCDVQARISGTELAHRFDELLQNINCEYSCKRKSGRLAAPTFACVSLENFITRVSDSRESLTWESQFKLLPLYKRLWR